LEVNHIPGLSKAERSLKRKVNLGFRGGVTRTYFGQEGEGNEKRKGGVHTLSNAAATGW